MDRALGIQWNTEEDKLEFKVKLKEKPMNRRGMLSIISSVYDPLGLVSPHLLKGKNILQNFCYDSFELGWKKYWKCSKGIGILEGKVVTSEEYSNW